MNISKSKSLLTKLMIYFLIIVVAISTLFNVYNYFREKAQKEEKLYTFAAFTSERLSKNFVSPLWDMEYKKLEDIIRFEMGDKQIYSIFITDPKGEKVIAGAERDDNWQITFTKSLIETAMIEASKVIEKDGEKLGIVRVNFTKKFMNEELRTSFLVYSIAFQYWRLC